MLKFFRDSNILRNYSVKKHDTIKYTKTINLPCTRFPARLTAAKRQEIEKKLILTTFAETYQYQDEHLKGPSFILHDGPPYANGDLHMGHAVNKILKDITIRKHVLKGQKIHYVPGWDCHGLPIELKALASTSVKKAEHDSIVVRSKSRQFALDAINGQKEEFNSWGILADWFKNERLYFTSNPNFICDQLQLFFDFYKKGLVYRDLKPVYWSPSSRTALAEAELEYDANFVSPSVYVRFKLTFLSSSIKIGEQQNLYALIWTTTPWTLPSNQAICFNSNYNYSVVELKSESIKSSSTDLYLISSNLIEDFVRYTKIECMVKQIVAGADLQICTYQHPIYENEDSLPFLDASHVQGTKGTGLVHTAPAHGPDDFLICLTNKIAVKSLVNEEGIYNSDAPSYLQGKNVLKEGNDLVLKRLKNDILFSDTLSHSYPLDWRTKEPVIIRASEQWFLNTSALKEKAIKEIEKIKIYPRINSEASKNALRTQIIKRPYWCISRQRSWGVPIPVFYNKNSKKVFCDETILKYICNLVTQKGNIDFWWSKSIEELLPQSLLAKLNINISDLEKSMDIFDIWFDSGSTWLHVLKDKQADLYLEGYDQFTGWFQSSLLTSVGARDCAPYKALFVHGFTVDGNGHKMSKSLGNVISPAEIRKTYGVDVLRWWVASHGTQHMTIAVSDKLLQQSAENLSKIRSTLRYLNGIIGERYSMEKTTGIDKQIYLNRYLLSKLFDFEKEVFNLYDCYEYNRVVAYIQNFITNQISAIYVNLIKDRLYCGTQAEIKDIRQTLKICYKLLNKTLWPIAPFLVEESWSYYDASMPFYQEKIVSNSSWKNHLVEKVIDTALNVKRLINKKNTEKNSWLLAVTIKCNESNIEVLKHLQPVLEHFATDTELCEILQVGSVMLQKSKEVTTDYDVQIEKIEELLCPRCRRYALLCENEVCKRCHSVLIVK